MTTLQTSSFLVFMFETISDFTGEVQWEEHSLAEDTKIPLRSIIHICEEKVDIFDVQTSE